MHVCVYVSVLLSKSETFLRSSFLGRCSTQTINDAIDEDLDKIGDQLTSDSLNHLLQGLAPYPQYGSKRNNS